MTEQYPTLVYSDLSGTFSQDGTSVELFIVKLEGSTEWVLEVLNSHGKSVVWEETFCDEKDAYIEFLQTIAEQGIYSFNGKNNVIQFPGC
jgi:hypothetical protein